MVYTEPGIDVLAKAVADAGVCFLLDVHLKVDTGMHRVGLHPRRRRPRWRRTSCARMSRRSRAS